MKLHLKILKYQDKFIYSVIQSAHNHSYFPSKSEFVTQQELGALNCPSPEPPGFNDHGHCNQCQNLMA
jgi:hypothetical protein